MLNGLGGVYSQEEQVIGTWIDGKPIYQRTLVLDWTHPDKADATYQHSWDVSSYNIDTPIDCKMTYISQSYPMTGFGFGNNSIVKAYSLTLTQDYLRVFTGNDATSRLSTIYATIQYTKTTD